MIGVFATKLISSECRVLRMQRRNGIATSVTARVIFSQLEQFPVTPLVHRQELQGFRASEQIIAHALHAIMGVRYRYNGIGREELRRDCSDQAALQYRALPKETHSNARCRMQFWIETLDRCISLVS